MFVRALVVCCVLQHPSEVTKDPSTCEMMHSFILKQGVCPLEVLHDCCCIKELNLTFFTNL